MKQPAVWEPEQGGSSTTERSRDNLAAMFRPPFALMVQGPFEKVGYLYNFMVLKYFHFLLWCIV